MLMIIFFVVCFFVAETIVSRYVVESPLVRFFLRVVLLTQYTLLIKYIFEYFDDGMQGHKEKTGMQEPSGGSEVQDKIVEN